MITDKFLMAIKEGKSVDCKLKDAWVTFNPTGIISLEDLINGEWRMTPEVVNEKYVYIDTATDKAPDAPADVGSELFGKDAVLSKDTAKGKRYKVIIVEAPEAAKPETTPEPTPPIGEHL